MPGLKQLICTIALLGLTRGVPLHADEDELKAVVVMFRHGDRSPLSAWPNDNYFHNSTLWPDGYGQLNNLGKQRHYQLGQWFRERYNGFLSKRYNYGEIYVRSTDVDRTLMSAEANLAGLYPPEGDQVWSDTINWQPIPVHTVPEGEDVIVGTNKPCPKHTSLESELMNSDEFKQLNENLTEFFNNISEVAGYSSISLTTFQEIQTTISIYRQFNLSLPEWTDTYWDEIFALAALAFQVPTYTQELARLRVGPFFNYVIDHLSALKNQVTQPQEHVRGPRYQDTPLEDVSKQKFLMLSAHDTNVADRLNAMGLYDAAAPYFSSTIIWELKGGNNGTFINMYFKNNTHFEELILPGCTFDCDFDSFVDLLKPITTTLAEWTEECKL